MAKENSGYIGTDKNGKWFARITVASNGKRKNIIRRAKDKAEARSLLKLIKRGLEDNGINFREVSHLSFNDLADFYETHYLKPACFIDERKISGLRDWKHVAAILKIFREYFGKQKLKDITYPNLVSFRAIRLKTPTKYKKSQRSITTVNRELTYLKRIFNIAIQENWLEKNPFSCGEPLIKVSAERKRERILTIEEEARLIKACEHPQRRHLKPLLIALLDTGARKGEMLKLQWKDVDFEKRLITIQALNTKTLKKRQVAITKRLFEEFLRLWNESNKDLNSIVFGISDNVRKSFSSACKIAGIKEGGIEGLTLHVLRHSAATRLVKGHLPIQMVGRILGHQNPQTTYRYLSANDETLRQAATIFESLQDVEK
jgi:integrase